MMESMTISRIARRRSAARSDSQISMARFRKARESKILNCGAREMFPKSVSGTSPESITSTPSIGYLSEAHTRFGPVLRRFPLERNAVDARGALNLRQGLGIVEDVLPVNLSTVRSSHSMLGSSSDCPSLGYFDFGQPGTEDATRQPVPRRPVLRLKFVSSFSFQASLSRCGSTYV